MAEIFPLTIRKFFVMWLGCLALVLLTYNPFELSYYHWLLGHSDDYFSLKVAVGVGLLLAYIVLFWIIGSQLGRVGVATGLLLMALTINAALEQFDGATPLVRKFITVLCIGSILAVGLTWPHIRVNLAGIFNKRYLIPKKKYRKRWHWWHWY
ncbi:hypothetical protein TI04_09935 [Achromatium sp. WMS2]|nr:hypothetical protein TI04_09935 [Achromatium sp. WMS2]